MQFDEAKFRAAVLYVIWVAGKRDWFGATKLNKVLWFADARLHALRGEPITGETYIREKFGPVPHHIMPLRDALVREGAIAITQEDKLTRIVALSQPDVSALSEDEIATLNFWIDHIDKNQTADSVSEETHDYAWEIAEMGEELPLYAYRVARIEEPTKDDIERLRARAEELGLD